MIRLRTSTDGDSWSAASTLFSPTAENDARDPALTELASGRVVCAIAVRNSSTEKVEDGGYTLYSDDDGDTWSDPIQIDADFTDWAVPTQIVELANGDWLLSVWGQDVGDGDDWSVRAIKSSDDGTTWTTVGTIADGVADSRQYNETGLYFDGTTVIAMIRDETGGADATYWRSTSTDDGTTWSALTQLFADRSGRPLLASHDGFLWTILRKWVSSTDTPHQLLRSSDDAQTWEVCEQLNPSSERSVYGHTTTLADGSFALVHAVENEARDAASVFFRKESA